jgi:hypothetical protein
MTVHNQTALAGDEGAVTRILHFKDVLELGSRVTNEKQAKALYAAAVTKGDTVLAEHLLSIAAPQGWNLTIPTTKDGAESIRSRALLVDLMDLALGASARVKTAENFNDTRFTADSVAEARTRYIGQASEDISAEATGILSQMVKLDTKATARALAVAPVYDTNDANQVTRTGQEWQFNVLPQLGGVAPWGNLLPTLTTDGLLAVQRFAPAWIKANSGPSVDTGSEIAIVLRSVQDALPATITDQAVRAVLTNAADTSDYLQSAQPIAAMLTGIERSRDVSMIGVRVQNVAYSIGALNELTRPAVHYVQM